MTEKKEKKEKDDDEIKNIDNMIADLAPALGGLTGGIITPKIYEKILSDQEKEKWEEKVQIHHGEVGVWTTIISGIARALLEFLPKENKIVKGAKKLSEAVLGFGAGLVIDDIDDVNKWFKRKK